MARTGLSRSFEQGEFLHLQFVPVRGNSAEARDRRSNQATVDSGNDHRYAAVVRPVEVVMQRLTIFSIGHSNHDVDTFLDLLRQHEIEVLVDVRTAPYSRYSPHFSRRSLEAYLREAGIDYIFHGQALGGRPDDPDCYDDASKVDYQRIATKPWFRDGIDSLLSTARDRRVAMMCSEENPEQCHRHRLIADTLLRESYADVQHIRGDGRLERAELNPLQTRLF